MNHKEDAVYNGILLSHKEEQNFAVSNNMELSYNGIDNHTIINYGIIIDCHTKSD